MLTYYNFGYNGFEFRTGVIDSSATYLRVDLQDMYTLQNNSFIMSPGQWSYNPYESIVSMSFQLTSADNVTTGSQYRMSLTPWISGSGYLEPVWHGSLQVFTSQSFNLESKSVYTNQIPVGDTFVSNVSTNEYIILT